MSIGLGPAIGSDMQEPEWHSLSAVKRVLVKAEMRQLLVGPAQLERCIADLRTTMCHYSSEADLEDNAAPSRIKEYVDSGGDESEEETKEYVLAVTFENGNQKETITINVDAEEYEKYRESSMLEELGDWIENKCYADATLDWNGADIDVGWKIVS